jgi:hypothetical protein
MEEDPENGKESSNSAHADGMNESVGKHKHLYQDAWCKNKDYQCWIHV